MSSSPAVPAPVSQSFQAPPLSEDPTGALPGSAVAAPAPLASAPYQSPDALPGASSQPAMGMMGGAPADMAPVDPGTARPSSSKPSPLILGALAVVVLLGLGTTVWVLLRPSKPAVTKTEGVDAGPAPDAMPSEAEKAAQAEALAKQQKPKKDDLLGITAEQRDALIEKGQKPLKGCFSKLLKKEPKLAGSALNVEVTIGPKGKVEKGPHVSIRYEVNEHRVYVIDPANEYPVNYSGHLKVTLTDGKVLELRQPHMRGGKREPLSRDELIRKYHDNAIYGGWQRPGAEKLLDFCLTIENQGDLGGLKVARI